MKPKSKAKKIIAIITLVICASVLVFGTALAAGDNAGEKKDSSGNVFFGGENAVVRGTFFGGYGAGKDLKIKGTKAEDSLALAGMNIDVSDTKAGGSVYIAGMSIAVKNTQAEGNMFSAASDVTVDNKTTCNGAYFTGQTVQFDGKAKALNISAESASFNGNVQGDVTIDGENVSIGSEAVVSGTLKIESSKKPEIADGAKIGDLKVKIVKDTTGKPSIGQRIKDGVFSAIYWSVAMILLGLLLLWIARGHIEEASSMVKRRKGAMLGSGAIALIVVPFAVILCLITIIGAPAGLFVGLLYLIVLVSATAFTGASLGPVVFKKMSPIPAGIIGIIILVVLEEVPYLGALVSIAAAIYTLGYLVQTIHLKNQERKLKKAQAMSGKADVVIPELEDKVNKEAEPAQETAADQTDI